MHITSSGLVLKGCDVASQTKWYSIGHFVRGQTPTVKLRRCGGPPLFLRLGQKDFKLVIQSNSHEFIRGDRKEEKGTLSRERWVL